MLRYHLREAQRQDSRLGKCILDRDKARPLCMEENDDKGGTHMEQDGDHTCGLKEILNIWEGTQTHVLKLYNKLTYYYCCFGPTPKRCSGVFLALLSGTLQAGSENAEA